MKNKYIIHFGDADKNRINPIIPIENRHEIPHASSENFINILTEISNRLKIDIIIPGVDEELELFANNINMFSPTRIVIPNHNFINHMGDKYEMVRFLEGKEIKVPKTVLLSDDIESISYPCISKPRKGRGSRLVIEHIKPETVFMFIKSF